MRNEKRAAKVYSPEKDFLGRLAAEDLALRLSAIKRTFEKCVIYNPASPLIAKDIQQLDSIKQLFQTASIQDKKSLFEANSIAARSHLPFKNGSFDLFISALTLQFINDVPGFLIQARNALKPDGLFLSTFVGGHTLQELRSVLLEAEADITGSANARILPFIDVRDAGSLLQRAGFALPVTDTDRLTVRYDTIFHLMRDLRWMGATNPLHKRSRSFLKRSMLERAATLYAERHSDPDGRVRATFEIISMSGWVPHESQQKPLQPGSADVSLTQVLQTKNR